MINFRIRGFTRGFKEFQGLNEVYARSKKLAIKGGEWAEEEVLQKNIEKSKLGVSFSQLVSLSDYQYHRTLQK